MIEWHTHSSTAIKGFPVEDNHERNFPVYLPPGYSRSRSEPYPVIFLLSGWGGRGSHYIADDNAFDLPLPLRLDNAISAGRLRPAIVVFPDGTSRFGCSQYVNSPAQGNYQDYLCDELVSWVDEKFNTHRDPHFRLIAGHSSGGFGALVAGMMRPDVFKYVCSSAGDSFYELSLLPGVNKVIMEVEKAGGLEKFLQNFREAPSYKSVPGEQVEAMLTLNMCACYAPNPSNPPLYADLFFDLKTGEIIPEVWDKMKAWDPVQMVDRYRDNLKSLAAIQLEAGLQDEHGLQLGHRQLAKKFSELGLAYELVEYPGKHGGHHWRFEKRFARLLNKMYES